METHRSMKRRAQKQTPTFITNDLQQKCQENTTGKGWSLIVLGKLEPYVHKNEVRTLVLHHIHKRTQFKIITDLNIRLESVIPCVERKR